MISLFCEANESDLFYGGDVGAGGRIPGYSTVWYLYLFKSTAVQESKLRETASLAKNVADWFINDIDLLIVW